MRKTFLIVGLLASSLLPVGCGSNTGPAKIETYPPVTAEEQKVIDQNIADLKDEAR